MTTMTPFIYPELYQDLKAVTCINAREEYLNIVACELDRYDALDTESKIEYNRKINPLFENNR